MKYLSNRPTFEFYVTLTSNYVDIIIGRYLKSLNNALSEFRIVVNIFTLQNKPWQCQFCEKSFATTSDLKQHMSSHGMGKIHKVGVVTTAYCYIL